MGGLIGVFEVDWIFFTQILMLNVTRFRVEYRAFFDLDTTIFEEPCTGNKKNETFSNISQILNFSQWVRFQIRISQIRFDAPATGHERSKNYFW